MATTHRRTRAAPVPGGKHAPLPNGLGLPAANAGVRRQVSPPLLILDEEIGQDLIRDRQQRGIDQYDEVWEGLYVMPPLANNAHQDLVTNLAVIAFNVINLEGRGRAQAGANVSDRRTGWKKNYRVPDLVVVL